MRFCKRFVLPAMLMAFLAACSSTGGKGSGSGLLYHPVAGSQVTSTFGKRNGRPHNGVDYAAPKGTPVKAVGAGRVVFVGSKRGFGRLIIISHGNNLETWYAHLSKIYVDHDARVTGGMKIGRVGATGNATGPHLHLETRINGKPVDPKRFLR